jgi:uncharacterized membrane-anchored protein
MKVVRFFKALSVLLFVVGFFLIGNSLVGTVRFSFSNITVEFPITYFFIGLIVFSVGLIFAHAVWKMLWSIPEKYQKFLEKKRKIKAENLIIDAISSLLAEQPYEAQNATVLADHLLPNNAIVSLLEGFSAHILNEKEKAISVFNKLQKEERLRFLALYGLILESKKQNEHIKIKQYLEDALKLRHDSPWVLRQLLENDLKLIQEGYKTNAEKGIYTRLLSKDMLSKHLALQHFLLGQKFLKHHDVEGAKDSFKKALLEDPSHLAAAIELVQLTKGKDLKVYKILMKSAKIVFHPSLFNGLLISGAFESPTEAYQELSESLSQNNYETALFLSQLALRAQLFEISKHFAEKAMSYQPTSRSKSQLQTVQKLLNIDSSPYMGIALTEDFSWGCKTCCRTFLKYDVFCSKCHSVDTIGYGRVDEKDPQESVKPLDVLLSAASF